MESQSAAQMLSASRCCPTVVKVKLFVLFFFFFSNSLKICFEFTPCTDTDWEITAAHVWVCSKKRLCLNVDWNVTVFLLGSHRQGHQPGCQPHPRLPSLLQQTVERCQVCHEDSGRELCSFRESPGETRAGDERQETRHDCFIKPFFFFFSNIHLVTGGEADFIVNSLSGVKFCSGAARLVLSWS